MSISAGRTQKNHKYLFWEFVGQTAVRCGNWKAYKPRKGQWELYDLKTDPLELKSVYGDRAYADIKKRLHEELKRLRKENKRLEMEREILKKAAAFFANESK